MNKYAQLIKELRAKNLTDDRIKEAVLEKSKTEITHFNFWFKSFKVKGTEEGEKKSIEIQGYASTKDIDRYGDIVNPSAFEETMELFMKNPVLLLQHSHEKRIGDVTEYDIDTNGLFIKADVKYTAWDAELFDKIEGKSLKGFSIWFRVLEAEFQDITDAKGNVVDWVFIINKLDLVEISVVNVPANPYTLMKSAEDLCISSFKSVVKELEDDEEEDTSAEEEVSAWDDNTNDNQDDAQDENTNDEETEEEKEIKVEKIKDGDDKETSEEDKESEENTEDKLNNEDNDTEEENNDDVEDEKNLDGEEEKDNIDNEDADVENPGEELDGEENLDEGDEKAFTTKMIEKIVDAKISGDKKAFKSLVEKEVKTLTKFWTKELETVKSDLEKELDAMVDIIKEIKETEQEIVSRIKSSIKGKGFLNFQTTKEKKKSSSRLEKILAGVQNNNKF